MRVLIVRLSALGDVVCTLPVASAIKSWRPSAEVVWLVDKAFAAIPQACRNVDRVEVRPKKLAELRSLLAGLGEFDHVLDMQGLLKSGAAAALAKGKDKRGYHWQREGSWLFTSAVRPDPTSIHVVDQYVDVARSLGADVHCADFALTPAPEAVASVQEKLSAAGRDPARRLILMNAGAGWSTKRWSPAGFAQVARETAEAGAQACFLGAPSDREVLQEVLACQPGEVLDMVGKTSIAELIALVSLANAHLAGDTGSTHLAAALGVKAYGVYTLTRPERSCPYGQIHRCRSLDPSEVSRQIIEEALS